MNVPIENPKIEKMSNVNTDGQSSLPFQYAQTNELSEITFNKHGEQNNLSYYNLPMKNLTPALIPAPMSAPMSVPMSVPIPALIPVPMKQEQRVIQKIEKFEDVKGNCEPECDLYVKHILECNKCKSVAMKQLGIESDKVRNEEIMEVVSYIVFGLFILLLIDSLKSDKK